jgi:hypothetical protein
MKHATSLMLFAYWDKLRAERAAPERADIVPGAIRHVLADTFILGVEDGGAPATFRLAGTRCCALFGRSLKDEAIASLWPEPQRVEVQRQVDMLLLPLRHRGSTGARALGSLAPIRVPSWLGLVPLTKLETTSLRIVSAARERRHLPNTYESPPPRRERFVVYEGGRQ